MYYEELIERLFQGEMEGVIREGTAFSFPVAGKIENIKCDKFFLYTIERKTRKHNEPFARLALEAEEGQLLLFQEKERGGEGDEILAPELPFEQYGIVLKAFRKDYMRIRKIAYCEDCTVNDCLFC